MVVGGLIFTIGLGLKVTETYSNSKNKIYIPHNRTEAASFLKKTNLNWQQMKNIYAPAKDIDDWRKLVQAKHWRKGYSAYELAYSWVNANPELPQEINALFAGKAELLLATPEHKTPLPGGNTPSQSDALAFIRTKGKVCAVTIEGKAKESFDQTVGEWSQNASAGKKERLKYISKKLGLSYPPDDGIRYQLLHRAAAAVIEAEHFGADCAAMIVHSFAQNRQGFQDFKKLLKSFNINSATSGKLYQSKRKTIPLWFGWANAAH